ncbi:MAG: zinc ABC transporter substrate-binding protein [Stappia sp.]|uniref:zinc ABC transporter substrate-binding protein n=1 Tax=Stappia sp. TaxID=1870903 RepID=UPI000C4BAEB3|nr:zinc ABC transporter substrate-binding protein [Stappia sp.]MAB00536.1 zinc ABC transporter substrate-binding protein [Stappia sp.]MBM20913.1 zinc ABC transporter substrate-binding protein [Stappia sp.]
MSLLRSSIVSALLLCSTSTMALSETPNVVASIKPVHSLVATIMQGVGSPQLILEGASSPHTASFKPSQAGMLEQADIVFWVGEDLEPFLEKPIETIGSKAHAIALGEVQGVTHLAPREGGAFEAHDHDHDGHADHDDHAAHDHGDHDHGHDHEEHAHEGHDHDHEGHDHDSHAGHEHGHGEVDPHVWLDPENARAMARVITEELVEHDPDNKAAYEANLAALNARLDSETAEIRDMLAPVKDKGFIVFHDAYQYFEKRFGLAAAGSITVSPEVIPGAERVSAIKAKIGELGATCVFAEPQFEPKLIAVVTEGTNARTGTLDPLGAALPAGPDQYFGLMNDLATSLKDCLAGES